MTISYDPSHVARLLALPGRLRAALRTGANQLVLGHEPMLVVGAILGGAAVVRGLASVKRKHQGAREGGVVGGEAKSEHQSN